MKQLKNMYESALSPKAQEITGITLFAIALVAWPLSASTVAKAEPPYILGLSWLAVILTAYCILVSARTDRHVREK